LAQWTDAFPSIPVFGGMASGNYSSRTLQVYCGGNVYQEGAVALAIGGGVRLSGIVSQGCTPIGDAWTITKAEGNLILEIANQPARKLLERTLDLLPPEERELSRNNLFVGLAMDEYKTELERGDFLIRNILEADPDLGSLAIGALPRVGQTVQFHRRDKPASEEDFTVLLRRAQNQLAGHRIFGACLCSCNGRGRRLFGPVNHDAAKTQQAFGPTGVAGFFCNGEFGPVGDQSFLHGYTASLALFTEHQVAGQGFLDSPSGLPQP
ncbi:MAG: histidine kinase, partial [Verrucomicrobia bacterium]|nr:histidine kinase [Verrucomicrobiota bacterium]